MSTRRKIVIVLIVVLAVVIAVGIWQELPSRTAPVTNAPAPGSTSASGTQGGGTSPTSGPVPAGTVVPQKGATSTPAGVAVPAVQSPGDPSGNVTYRSFGISIQNETFSPSTVIVNQGDTVDLEITAADANYAFTQPDYGFNDPIAKGKTQRIQFQALQSGDFIFYCGSCGGPSRGPVGHLIVVPRQ